jgi:molybdopterin-biosynthesis enzyme MoeA-like protein
MGFGALITGDEILSGRREDRHMAQLIRLLAVRGLELAWCRYLGDDAALIAGSPRETFARGDIVFCFGGIGATPDDLTRQCAAEAAAALARIRQGIRAPGFDWEDKENGAAKAAPPPPVASRWVKASR